MMIQHRTNLPVAIIDARPLDHTIMLTTSSSPSSSPTSSATAFFGGQHLRLDNSFDSLDSVSSELSLSSSSSSSSSSSFSLKQRKRKPIKQMKKNQKHNFIHHHHHHHHRNDFLFCGLNENGGFVLANTCTTPTQQQPSINMDLLPQHSSSVGRRPIIEFTLFANKDNENNNNADNVIIPERLLVPLL